MKDQVFGVLQRIGRSFMLPIALLPVAGLLLGIGGSFSNVTMLEAYGLTRIMGPGTFWNTLFTVMSRAGDIVFANLPILFAMGIAIGMAKKEKEVAALAAVISFLVMHASIGAMIAVNGGTDSLKEGAGAMVAGIRSLQMGVFGGILVGLGTAWLHNKYYRIELPQVLSFFGGTRFVPIVSALFYVLVGILMYFIWPPVQAAISGIGGFVLRSGYLGTWFYGFMERALIPFGLHHVFYIPFWQTAVGGTMEVAGQVVQGGQNIFFAQLADSANIAHFSADATRYFSGEFIFMIFGLPGAALAMYRCAKPEKKKAAGGLLLSAALACMFTGITEPLEFSFLFVAPALFVVQVILAGAAYMIAHMLNIAVGLTFSGGFIDLFLFGILQGNAKTSWIRIIPVGIIYFFLYYFIFSFLIKKLDLKTPGREDDDAETKLYTKADVNAKKAGNTEAGTEGTSEDSLSAEITRGLGGSANIEDVDCCATRLRCTVSNADLVNDGILKATGASGVVHRGRGVQIIYGPGVTVIKANLEDYLEHAPKELYEPQKDAESTGQNISEDDKIETKAEEKKIVDTIVISSPITGVAADLSTTPDEAFAGRMMGDGAVVTPEDAIVRAPEDGEVCFVFDTKHAIGFMTESGVSLLIHVGIDTVKLDGKGFECFVENGQTVKKGDPMLKLDLDYLKANAPSVASPVLCTELEDNQKIRLLNEGEIKAGDELFAIDIYEA